ncbi:MAG: glycoside hydrolase family 2, partial [Oscillospiraceae bacterium]|nr:glycoside hydrolase family 2 [Oscillospiraceae bacterium]
LSVRGDSRAPNSRWYSGAGIYRKVWFKEYPECHLVSDGLYISGDIDGKVTVTTETERPCDVTVSGLSLRLALLDEEREVAAVECACCAADRSALPETVTKEDRKYTVNTSYLQIPEPVLWDVDDPHLYKCVAELIRDGQVIDRDESVFGLRKIEFTADKGFFLNGRHLKLHGCCQHHDMGALGAAVNKHAIARQLTKLREMGANAIRTSHNMPATELMELADEMGFLILSEGFDMWERQKTDYDYARFFPKWVDKDVSSWVRRDRNHPSIIGWSIGNEIYDTHADERGQEVTSLLLRLVKLNDPRGNGYVTIGSNYMQWENAQKCADILKVAGYNYAERLYNEQHEKHPDWFIYGSETSSVLQSRGIYHFPFAQPVLADDDEQCSALGNTVTGWSAKSTEACIIPDRDAEFCAGQFIWTGFDYIGEPTPYSTKNSYFGQIETAGFLKDSA